MNYLELNVDKGIKHLSDWKGMYSLPSGRILLNKSVTGCGGTTFYLNNDENVILCSPRTELLSCKLNDANVIKELVYYDAEIPGRDFLVEKHIGDNCVFKILVTYDSFPVLMNFLIGKYGYQFANSFKIVIDEYQELVNDAHFKAVTEMIFIREVFKYSNLVFVTATPILEKYMMMIPEFQMIDWFVKLVFDPSDVEEIVPVAIKMKSVSSAFESVLREYKVKGNFGEIYSLDGSGRMIESKEAVFFLNNVSEICSLLKKYKDDLTGKVNVVCGKDPGNQKKLHKVGFSVGSVPKKGEQCMPFTFVTRTAFAGIDMYSPTASTFVFANYTIDAMLVDVSLDLRQIGGRQRDENNQFRNKITVFYKENPDLLTQEDFDKLQATKDALTQEYLDNLCMSNNSAALRAIEDRVSIESCEVLKSKQERLTYLSIVEDANGQKMPFRNSFIKVAEQRQWEMFQYRNLPLLISKGINSGNCSVTNPILEKLKADLYACSNDNRARLKLIHDCYVGYPGNVYEVEKFVSYLGYMDEAECLNKLGPEQVKACGYDFWKIKGQLFANDQKAQISFRVGQMFFPGLVYSKKDVKDMLQKIYDDLGIQKKAKATDLEDYIKCTPNARLDGNKAYRIL